MGFLLIFLFFCFSSGFFFDGTDYTTNTTVNQSNYNYSAYISADTGNITINYYENHYGNCSLETETCLATIPTNLTNTTTNLHISDCNPSTAYDTSVCAELSAAALTIWVDGNITNNFTNAGEPYNVTIQTAQGNTLIKAEECNGLNHFSLIQSIDSNVTNCAYTTVETDANGFVSYTHIPTGGEPSYNFPFTYTIKFQAIKNNAVQAEENLTVINRAPPSATAKGSLVVNKPNVEGTNERILIVFDRISRSRISGAVAGETFDMVVYDNGSSSGTGVTITSGRPTGLNVTIMNSTSLSPIPNATIKIREDSGLMHWGLIQYASAGATTNVSNYVESTTTTNSNGNVRFAIIPTSGFVSSAVDQAIGNYTVTLQVILPNGTTVFNSSLDIDRSLPSPSPTSTIPNSGEVEGFNEKVLVLYDRVSKYIE